MTVTAVTQLTAGGNGFSRIITKSFNSTNLDEEVGPEVVNDDGFDGLNVRVVVQTQPRHLFLKVRLGRAPRQQLDLVCQRKYIHLIFYLFYGMG